MADTTSYKQLVAVIHTVTEYKPDNIVIIW